MLPLTINLTELFYYIYTICDFIRVNASPHGSILTHSYCTHKKNPAHYQWIYVFLLYKKIRQDVNGIKVIFGCCSAIFYLIL